MGRTQRRFQGAEHISHVIVKVMNTESSLALKEGLFKFVDQF